MRVHLLPFGVLKDELSFASLELPSESTVGDLLARLTVLLDDRPAVRQLLPRIAVSVNAEYALASHVLQPEDHVGLLPPVSGGSTDPEPVPAVVTAIVREVIASDALVAAAKQGSDGAVVAFDGIVRDNTRGRRTLYLDYEAYEEMALRLMGQLSHQAIEKFGVRAVTLIHRLGRLYVGETSVLIIVASAHRGAAFDACRWLIDTLKKTVPIWKKETFVDGAVWADGEPFPAEIVADRGQLGEGVTE